MAYWVGRDNMPGPLRHGRILVAPITGGEPDEIGHGRSPVWSPDGQHLLYTRARGSPPESEWVVARLEGEEPVASGAMDILRESGLDGDPKILWHPVFVPQRWLDDDSVLFSAGSGQAVNIWSIQVSPSSGRVSGSAKRITTGSGEHRYAGAAAGNRIVFADLTENEDVWTLPVDSNLGVTTGEIQRATSNAATDHYPSLSADGTKLAFWSGRGGGWSIWLKDLSTQ